MSTDKTRYQFTRVEVETIQRLAAKCLNSRQTLGRSILDDAGIVKRITDGCAPIPRQTSGLEPREICIMCGSIGGEDKAKKEVCPDCCHPFTRGNPWRRLRGKRRHVVCIEKANQKTS